MFKSLTVIGERVQRWARAPAIRVCWRDVLWPTPPASSDLPCRSARSDEVVQRETKVRLEDEEHLDDVFQLVPTVGGRPTESVDDGGGHGEGKGTRGGKNIFMLLGGNVVYIRQEDVTRGA